MSEPLDNPPDGDDISSREGPKAPNQRKGAKRNRLSGAVRSALEDLVFALWEASPNVDVRNALLRWKARHL